MLGVEPQAGAAARMLAAELTRDGADYTLCNAFKELGEASVPELVRMLHEPKTRLEVLTTLGKRGASAAKAVKVFEDDPDVGIRTQARTALEAFGESDQ